MLDASVNRLLHQPTTRLRQAASESELETPPFPELVSALEHVFALDEQLADDVVISEPQASAPPGEAVAGEAELEASSGVTKLGAR